MQARALLTRILMALGVGLMMLASIAAASGAARPAECASRNLLVSEQKGQGAAGTFIFGLAYRNSGQQSCSISGFPGVTLYGAGHKQLAVARRVNRTGRRVVVRSVIVKAGHRAYGAITWGAIPHTKPQEKAQSCPRVKLLRVYPPGNRSPIGVPIHHAGEYCAFATVYPIAASPRASFG